MQQDLTQNHQCTPTTESRFQYFLQIVAWCSGKIFSFTYALAVQFICEINAMENLFIKMAGVYAFSCQVLFFMACETALRGPLDKTEGCNLRLVNSMTSILFYSVFGYFAVKIKEVVVEWLKAAAVTFCLREQGMKYQQDSLYTLITFSYYFCTEKLFLETLPQFFAHLNLDLFDNLEHFYVPIVMNLYALILGALFNIYLSTTVYLTFAAASSYFLIYLRFKDLYRNYLKKLSLERRTFASFKQATEQELKEWNDICAVCLSSMTRARVTPCNHFFHPNCLKQCLQVSFKCPLCKQNFVSPQES